MTGAALRVSVLLGIETVGSTAAEREDDAVEVWEEVDGKESRKVDGEAVVTLATGGTELVIRAGSEVVSTTEGETFTTAGELDGLSLPSWSAAREGHVHGNTLTMR